MLLLCPSLGPGADHGATAAPAAPIANETARPDSVHHRASPFSVMARSAVLPGWGQLYNHKPIKATVVFGGEGFLWYKAWTEFQKEQDAAEAGDQAGKDRHYNLKVNYIWWAIAAHLLQMADAYVDAHLAGFDAGFAPEDASHSAITPPDQDRAMLPSVRVAVHVRF